MVVGALLAACVGALLGFPIIRLAGIYPALATLAFALMFESVIVPLEWVSGGDVPVPVPRPLVGSIDMASDRPYLIFCVLCLTVLGLAVIAIRKGTTGRFLDALRGSEPAAASIGIHPYRTRLVAFVVGAGIAGFGGGLLASYNGQANYTQSFTFYFGLVWLVLVITAGHALGAGRGHRAASRSSSSRRSCQRLFAWPGNYLASNPDITGVPQSILEFVEPRVGARAWPSSCSASAPSPTPSTPRASSRRRPPRASEDPAARRQAARRDARRPGGGHRPRARRRRRRTADRRRRAGAARRRAGHPMTAVDAASPSATTGAPVLVAEHVGKRFEGIAALVDVSVHLDRGRAGRPHRAQRRRQVHPVRLPLGPHPPDSGRVTLNGHDLAGLPAHERARLGLARTFQRIELFAGLSVRDHLLVADAGPARAAPGSGAT